MATLFLSLTCCEVIILTLKRQNVGETIDFLLSNSKFEAKMTHKLDM